MFLLIFICFLTVYTANSNAFSAGTVPKSLQTQNEQPDNIFNEKIVEGVFIDKPETEEPHRKSRKRVTSMVDVVNCGIDVHCFLQTANVVLEERREVFLAEADAKYLRSNEARGISNESPSQLVDIVRDIIAEMTDIIRNSLSGWFRRAKEDEETQDNGKDNEVEEQTKDTNKADEKEKQDLQEESRGKKKKKKLKTLIKFLILGAVLKAKLTILLQLLSAALQVKFFIIALASLILNKIRLWYELKKGHQPQKVIYYEHAQHQHHYDHPEDEHSFWGRAYEVAEDEQEKRHDIVYKGQKPIPWSP